MRAFLNSRIFRPFFNNYANVSIRPQQEVTRASGKIRKRGLKPLFYIQSETESCTEVNVGNTARQLTQDTVACTRKQQHPPSNTSAICQTLAVLLSATKC